MTAVADADVEAFVHQAFARQSLADPGFLQQIDRALFEHAGADATKHILAGAPLEHDVVDALQLQQLGQQQARGARANNGDLRSHDSFFRVVERDAASGDGGADAAALAVDRA